MSLFMDDMEPPKIEWVQEGRRKLRIMREWSYRTRWSMINTIQSTGARLTYENNRLEQAFVYPRIGPSTQIRILELAPSVVNGPLVATLSVVDLDSPGYYEAVSHSWGVVSAADVIHCGSGTLNITRSISMALRQFRLPNAVRRLWIDTVCIDQGRSREKERQVALMGDIYKSAQATLVWLGEEGAETAWAFSIIAEASASTLR